MLDLKKIRKDPELFDQLLEKRGIKPQVEKILKVDTKHRKILTELQEIQEKRNEASKKIGILKSKGSDAKSIIEEVGKYGKKIQTLEKEERKFSKEILEILSVLPNILDNDVPQGKDSKENLVVKNVLKPKTFQFDIKDHVMIGEELRLMDFDAAANMSGARFVLLKNELALMERALINFMLELHTKKFGYVETYVPHLVKSNALYGTGQLPKFGDDVFQTKEGYFLIPTAEVSLTNIVSKSILRESDLPLRYVAYTPCYRSEAGAAGKDTKGMFRQHQFGKVELVSIVSPENSEEELERMTNCAEEILKMLELPYRIVLLSSGDTGFSAAKTFDIEVWIPSQDKYREISSCSNCRDFQSRRMDAKFRVKNDKKIDYPHTLNGSGLAVGRTIIAILENYQDPDGSVIVPIALRKYMGGIEKITRKK